MQRLYKRGDTWWCSFYVNGVRVRQSTGCRDKRAAEARAAELERRAADPTHAAANEATLADALSAVAADRRAKGRAEGTITMHRTKAGHLVRVLGADRALSTIDAAAVDAFIEQRLGEGAARSTVHKELCSLRVALKIAIRRGRWQGRLEAVMPEGFSLDYKPKTRALTRDEFDRLLVALRPGRAAHVAFIVGTGARWIESERAQPSDVAADANGGSVHLRGSKTEGADRVVPLVGFMRELVARAALALPFEKWHAVRRDLAVACKRAGIAPVTPNDLRRTCATWLRGSGVPPSTIAVVLGHRDSRMVERVYGRLPVDALRRELVGHLGAPDGL